MLLHRRLWEDIRPAQQRGVHYAATPESRQRPAPHVSHAAKVLMLGRVESRTFCGVKRVRQKCQRCAFATRKSRNT